MDPEGEGQYLKYCIVGLFYIYMTIIAQRRKERMVL